MGSLAKNNLLPGVTKVVMSPKHDTTPVTVTSPQHDSTQGTGESNPDTLNTSDGALPQMASMGDQIKEFAKGSQQLQAGLDAGDPDAMSS